MNKLEKSLKLPKGALPTKQTGFMFKLIFFMGNLLGFTLLCTMITFLVWLCVLMLRGIF